jgi:hypothetical protein
MHKQSLVLWRCIHFHCQVGMLCVLANNRAAHLVTSYNTRTQTMLVSNVANMDETAVGPTFLFTLLLFPCLWFVSCTAVRYAIAALLCSC